MANIIRDTIRIDPLSLFPGGSHEPLWENIQLGRSQWEIEGSLVGCVFRHMGSFGRVAARKLAYLILKGPGPLPHAVAAHHFVTCSVNQRAALAPVMDQLSARGQSVEHHDSELKQSVKFRRLVAWGTLLAIPFLPILLFRMFREQGYRRRSFRWAFSEYWHAYGLYLVFRWWLRRTAPLSVVVSNDHLLLFASLIIAAKAENAPTFYIQHACVTKNFPPLSVDYALLDGRDAVEKYQSAGKSDTVIHQVGMPKFDQYAQSVNHSRTATTIGFAVSFADDLERATFLLSDIVNQLPEMAVVFRLHPRMYHAHEERFRQLCNHLGCGFSEKSTASFEFLSNIDVLVTGVSAMALEAALMNVTPLCFSLNDANRDWYGFVESGLCSQFGDADELILELKRLQNSRPAVRKRAKRYCGTIDTAYDGRSAELAADIITAELTTRRRQESTTVSGHPAEHSRADRASIRGSTV